MPTQINSKTPSVYTGIHGRSNKGLEAYNAQVWVSNSPFQGQELAP